MAHIVARLAAATGLVCGLILTPGVSPGLAAGGEIANVPVTFAVENTNTSSVLCPSDGAAYDVAGHLVGPVSALEGPGPRTVVLYLHGLDGGEGFWNFGAVPGYNHAEEMARLGHISVAIDRIGYGSAQPPGPQSCVGSQADVAHQVIGQLRAGSYDAGGRPGPRFERVALAGHSVGGAIAQVEAYSYKDVDALMVLLWADNAATRDAQGKFFNAGRFCLTGGEENKPSGAHGYTYFFTPIKDSFKAELFHDIDPTVLEAFFPLQNRNPCGDIASVLTALITDQFKVADIDVPVLLVYGDQDKVFSAPEATTGPSAQRNLYRGTTDVTEVKLANTGHFMTLERSAPQFRSALSTWLCTHNLGGSECPAKASSAVADGSPEAAK